MSAEGICLDRQRIRVHETRSRPSARSENRARAGRFQYWIGASGARYLHSVHDIFTCPEVGAANYILVRRNASTEDSEVLKVGHIDEGAPSLNLAELRHMAATLGAKEVHLHLLAENAADAQQICFDIEAALVPEPAIVH